MRRPGAVAGFGYARSEPKVYQSSASVMVVPEQGENAAELVQGSNYVQNLVASYAVLAQSPYVLEPVIEDLGLDTTPARLARSVSVNTPLNTVVIEIAVSDTSPDRAREIADGISDQLALAVPELSPQLADRSSAVRITTIAPARQPVNPIAPNTRLLMMVGLAAGLAVGVTYAVLRELLARRVVSSSSIQSMLGVPFLGEVVKVPSRTSLPAVVAAGPGAARPRACARSSPTSASPTSTTAAACSWSRPATRARARARSRSASRSRSPRTGAACSSSTPTCAGPRSRASPGWRGRSA